MSINPLGNLSGYSDILKIYNENKDKDWSEWLEFKEIFGKPGKQGVVGLLNVKGTKLKVIFKLSQNIDYLAQHEFNIMNGLNELSSYCPHFCKSICLIECLRNPKTLSTHNPFEAQGDVKYMIKDHMLVAEHVDKSNKFYNYIKSKEKINEEILYSTVKQVLLAISIAQKKKQFSHYDLHSLNIMMKKCNKDVVFVYVVDEENQLCVPTLGHYPVIIDYGFSYINDMQDGPLFPTLGHTASGFTSDRFDEFVDPKLFLATVSYEIKNMRKSKKSKVFRRIVKNMFGKLNISLDSGWNQDETEDVTDEVLYFTEEYSEKSIMFSEYESFCIDLIQTLVILPLEEQDHNKPTKSFKAFLKEWVKIENQITNHYYNLYILKGVVDAARSVRAAYMDPETTKFAVEDFTKMVDAKINEVTKFCNPKKLNYETMLCSLYVFANNIEGIYYEAMDEYSRTRKKEYSKIPLRSIDQIYAAVDTNIKTEYNYSDKTTVFVMDSIGRKTGVFTIDEEQAKKINSAHSFCRGTMLYDMYKTQS